MQTSEEQREQLTDREARVMDAVWSASEPTSIAAIYDYLSAQSRGEGLEAVSFANLNRALQGLVSRKLLSATRAGRSVSYTASVSREEVFAHAVQHKAQTILRRDLAEIFPGLSSLAKKGDHAANPEIEQMVASLRKLAG